MRAAKLQLSDLAVSDILEQATWYEARSDEKLATRWERAVTSTLLKVCRAPNAGSPCHFRASELQGTRRVSIAGFPKHLVFYRLEGGVVFVLRVIHGARDLESLFEG